MDEQLKNEYQPDYAVIPGDVLAHELNLRNISQQNLVKLTGLTPELIDAVMKGETAITTEIAIKLEGAIGMPVEYWLNLEAQYSHNTDLE